MSRAPRGGSRPAAPLQAAQVRSQVLHDLRNPLNQIIGYSEMLVESIECEHAATVASDLLRIRDAGRRMLAVIEENFTAEAHAPLVPGDADVPAPAAEPRAVVELSSATGTILVVDDDENNRAVLSRRLKREGHAVTTASSGREALGLLEQGAFDLLLLDIMMPDMDGYEVLGRIKSDDQLRHVPVIMISALNEVEAVVRCIQAGAEDYLTKPFNPTLLQARVGACIDKKRGRDRESALFGDLARSYRRLQELEKLRDDMRNMIVHDLRTPLTALIVGVDMVAQVGALNDIQRDMLSIAAGGGKTLLGMINDLLDVEKFESGVMNLEYEDLSAATLVAGAVEQVAALATEAETALLAEVPDAISFRGDRNKLSRTLVNLIANAVRFTRAGTVKVVASQAGGDVCFAVHDTGKGIPEEAFERIFEKFGQLSGAKVGTGLGLAFCKLAVEAHGGLITVESEPGVGSTFSFKVPMSDAGNAPA